MRLRVARDKQQSESFEEGKMQGLAQDMPHPEPAAQPMFLNNIEMERKERVRLRLVIGIPALMILISLTAGIITYEIVMDVMDKTDSIILKTRLESTANTILLANFVACGIALVFGVGLATYIIRPIRAVTRGARKVAKGDLTMKVQIPYHDELGDLGESFNTLISHLNNLFKT